MRLRQILTILLDNALKLTPADGAVSVILGICEDDCNSLRIEVSDTGCGIGGTMTERVFERLVQVNDTAQAGRKGLGLGLYIARELINRQDGKIWVTSEPGKGCRVFFTVPIFSIVDTIRPMLAPESKPEELIVVIAVDCCFRRGSQVGRQETLDAARKLIQRCLRPDTDVLLPQTISVGKLERMVVLGYSLEQGAEVISDRILRQFRGCQQLSSDHVEYSVSHSFLNPSTTDLHEPAEIFVRRVAAEIEDRLLIMPEEGTHVRQGSNDLLS